MEQFVEELSGVSWDNVPQEIKDVLANTQTIKGEEPLTKFEVHLVLQIRFMMVLLDHIGGVLKNHKQGIDLANKAIDGIVGLRLQ